MLVMRIIGDCPGCGSKDTFGNVSVGKNGILRGCRKCSYHERLPLPKLKKKIIYLDQFFFSHSYRENDKRFVRAAEHVRQLSHLHLLVAPFSSVHEDEANQWRGYADKNKKDLMDFIKRTSRGHEFKPAYDTERTQIVRAFDNYLADETADFSLLESDVLRRDIHNWDDYFWIDVGRYVGDVELMRSLKTKTTEQLVDLFNDWRKSKTTFEEDVLLELREAGKAYIEAYLNYLKRIRGGDMFAFLDSPINSQVVEAMLRRAPKNPASMKKIFEFFGSEHFNRVPYNSLSAKLFAALKDQVKQGAFINRKKAVLRLSGFFSDVKHVATYAPYCDAFVMDQSMASLVAHKGIDIEKNFDVKVFSLNNWNEFNNWLEQLENNISDDHKAGLAAINP